MTDTEPEKSSSDALQKILAVVSESSARGLLYTTALLGMAALIPNSNLSPELSVVATGLGIEALGSLLDRVANEDLSEKEIVEAAKKAIEDSNIDKLLTKDDFYHAFAHLRRGQRTLISQNQSILNTLMQLGVEDFIQRDMLPSSEKIISLRQSFLDWTIKANSEINIASLQVALPMSEAWTALRIVNPNQQSDGDKKSSFERQIQKYHDWHRLAESVEDKDIVDVEKVIADHQRVIVMGGAGVGKSTLMRRLTQIWSQQDKLILRVPLRTLALRVENGELFDEAIITVASEGFYSPDVKSSKILESATCLLADGLDETGSSRADIAQKLRLWASADQSRQVIVTTRPIGHNPAWFSDWEHCELLPLRHEDIKTFAHKIFGLLYENQETARKETDDFVDKLSSSRTASVAARSPQLLGFLIALHCNNHPIDGNRYKLFQAIVDEIAAYESQDRIFSVITEKIFADFVLDRVGWRLLENPFISEREINEEIGQQVAQDFDYPLKRGQQEVDKALAFWVERGLLERISIPSKTTLTFIHRGFQEFAAARYTSDISETDFVHFVEGKCYDPTFRETMLMTGATSKLPLAINILLKSSGVSDPVSTESLLAAEVLAEAENPPKNLRKLVYESLIPRLESNIPVVAYEATEKLLPLAHLNHEVIGKFAQQLSISDKAWAQEIGCLLCLIADEAYVNEQVLVKIYPNLTDTRIHSFMGGDFLTGWRNRRQPVTTRLLLEGARYLIGEGHVNIVLGKYKEGNISGYAHDQLQKILIQSVDLNLIMPLVSEKYSSVTKFIENLPEFRRIMTNALVKFFLDSSQALLHNELELVFPAPDASLKSNKIIYKALEIGKSFTEDIIGLQHQPEVITEVFKGVILVAGLNPRQVKVDAELAANIFAESEKERLNFTLSADEEILAYTIDWALATSEDLNADLLFSAVDHPTVFIRHFATLLLINCFEQDTVKTGFFKKLYEDNSETLRVVAYVAEYIWEAKTASLILERLEKCFTNSCAPLLELLGKLEFDTHDRQKLLAILRHALESPKSDVVEAASEAILNLEMHVLLTREIHIAYEYWLNNGPPYPQGAGVIPRNPANKLFSLLISSGTLTYVDLLEAATTNRRRDVKEIAMKEICKYLQQDYDKHQEVMLDIRENKLSSKMLLTLSKSSPGYCRKHTTDIVSLLKFKNFDGKLHCIQILGEGWAEIDEVEPILRAFLDDADPNIRNETVKTLRKLQKDKKVSSEN